MTTTSKSLLLGAGLAVAFAGAVSASERTRDTDVSRPETGTTAAAASVPTSYHQVSKGVAAVTIDGQEVLVRANNSVIADEVVAQYGSLQRAQFEAKMQNTPSTREADGTLVYANGAVGYFADILGTSQPKPQMKTVAEFKQVWPWVEQVVDGVTIMAFANNAVLLDKKVNFSEPGWMAHQRTVPNRVDENNIRYYADNAVFVDEPGYQPKDSQ